MKWELFNCGERKVAVAAAAAAVVIVSVNPKVNALATRTDFQLCVCKMGICMAKEKTHSLIQWHINRCCILYAIQWNTLYRECYLVHMCVYVLLAYSLLQRYHEE